MNDSTRILYVAADDETARRLESVFDDRPTDIELAYVASVDSALAALETRRIDRVVLDPTLAARATGDPSAELRDADVDVRIHTVSDGTARIDDGGGGPPPGGSSHGLRRPIRRRVESLADRIERAVADAEERTVPNFEDADDGRPADALRRGDPSRRDGPRCAVADGGVDGEHFRTLAQTLSDALLVVDVDSVVQFANPAVEDVFGYRPEELVGESLTKLMSPQLAERHRTGVRRYLDTGERALDWTDVELVGRRKDGGEVPISVSFGEFRSGGEVRFTGLVRDVSDRRCREQELRTRIRQQRIVASFSQYALEDRPLAALFDEAVELVADGLDHDYAGLLERRPDENDLLLRAGVGWREGAVGSTTVDVDRETQAGETLFSAEPIAVENFGTDDRFSRPELLVSHDVRGGIGTLVGPPDDPWGVLVAHDADPQSYADHDVQFVQSVARILATAVRRRQRERRRELYEAMLDAVGDGVYALDADGQFVAVNDAYCSLTGYDREQLLGAHVSTVIGEEFSEVAARIRTAFDEGGDVTTLETTLSTRDGTERPVEVRVSRFPIADDEFGRVGVVRDVTDRRRREEKLVVLTEMMGLLAETETSQAICEVAVDTAIEVLGFPKVAVALYDDDANALVPAVRRWSGDDVDDVLLGPDRDGVAWQTFVENDSRTYGNLAAALDADAETASAIVVPLGKHGVFVAGSSERAAFDATDSSLADVLCSNVRSALDRAEREVALRDQRNDLREKNRELERVNRLNRVIRELIKAVTQASSPEDVMQATCDRLAQVGPYRFAWFGEYEAATEEVRPRAWAGTEEGYLDDVTVRADPDDPTGWSPAGRAVRERELQVQNDLLGDPPFEPWRKHALKRGYRSCVSVPVVYGGSLRGVLSVYADESGAFNEMEQAVLAELGETIGYAMTALERKAALVSERSIELDFRIRGTDTPVLGFVNETEAEFEFENVVHREDGHLHAFFTVRGVPPEETLAYGDDLSWIRDVHLVAQRDGEYLYESTLGDDSFLRTLVDRGAIPRSITMTEGEGRFVIRIPQNADVRTFVNLFDEYYERAELVARREHDEPVLTRQGFEAELRERLTERQEEVLQTAYFSGFFEWPRVSTAQEIADALGVSQPTVSRHVRGGERELFGLLFEDW